MKHQNKALNIPQLILLCLSILITFVYIFCKTLLPGPNSLIIELLIPLFFISGLCILITSLKKKEFLLKNKKARSTIKKVLRLKKSEQKDIMKDLELLMKKEEIFLNNELTLKLLADKLDIHINILSYVINEKYRQNFNEYINSFRIQKFLTLSKSSNSCNDTILSFAKESGFSSKTTFNRVFKQKYGIPPRDYLSKKKSNLNIEKRFSLN